MAKRWTDTEISFLKENYQNMTSAQIGEKLGKSENAVQRKKEHLKLNKLSKKRKWTEEELDFIKNSSMTYDELAEKFNTNRDNIRYLFKQNPDWEYVNVRKNFTNEEDQFLINNHSSMGDYEIAKKLKRSPGDIGKRRRKLGLMREGTRIIDNPAERNWKPCEEDFLISNIDVLTYNEIAEKLGRTVRGVMIRASRLGLIKDGSKWSEKEDDLLRKYASYPINHIAFMLDRTPRAVAHRFSYLGLSSAGIGMQSSIEEKIEMLLIELGADYRDHIKLGKDFNYECDFVIGDIVIEVHGDYWHGNPRKYPEPTEKQQLAILKDKIKKEYFESLGYKVYEIWEEDINSDISAVREYIARLLRNE